LTSRSRPAVLRARSSLSLGQQLSALAIAVPGLAFLGLALMFLVLPSDLGAGALWFYAVGLALGGSALLGGALFNLPEVTRVVVDVPGGSIVVRKGRPLLRGSIRTIPLSQPSLVRLTKEDIFVCRSSWGIGGITVSKSRHYDRHWRVALDGSMIFWSLDEVATRRLAERIAAGAGVPLSDETGGTRVEVRPEHLDRSLVARLARGDIKTPSIGDAPSSIERMSAANVVSYAGCAGSPLLGLYWTVVLERERLGVRVGRFRLGWTRWLPLEKIELLRRDYRVYRRSKGIFGHSRRERQLLRLVSDRRVLSVPLNDEAEATWLAGRLMKDLVGFSPASR
jgi:hypothetical protein